MKRLLLLPLMVLSFLSLPAAANAIPPFDPGDIDLPQVQLKLDICHNGTIVPVSVNAAAVIDTGHGLFTPGANTFVARVDVPGHSTDTVLRYYSKFGNIEANLYVNPNQTCQKEEEPEEPTLIRVCVNGEVKEVLEVTAGMTVLGEGESCPTPTTVTTIVEKEVVKEVPVEKIVEKTVEVPGPTTVIEKTITVEKDSGTCEFDGKFHRNTATGNFCSPNTLTGTTGGGELPRTGAGNILTIVGGSVTALGLFLRRMFR